MATVKDYSKDLGFLVEAGLIAIKQGDEESAKKLFNAVGVIDPNNKARQMGFGLIAMHKMELNQAKKLFEEVLASEPANHRARAFLGFCSILNVMQPGGTNEEKIEQLKLGAECAKKVLAESDIPSTKQLAQSLLDWEKELEAKASSQAGPLG